MLGVLLLFHSSVDGYAVVSNHPQSILCASQRLTQLGAYLLTK
jgi:hypothetical protein